jgi:hypothetical protein
MCKAWLNAWDEGVEHANEHCQFGWVAWFAEVADRKGFLVAGDCNVLKIPSIPFSFEIIRPIAA